MMALCSVAVLFAARAGVAASAAPPQCGAQMAALCSAQRGDVDACDGCMFAHFDELAAAGCTHHGEDAFCKMTECEVKMGSLCGAARGDTNK